MNLLFALTIFFCISFIYIIIKDRRTLLTGVFFIAFLVSIGVSLSILLERYNILEGHHFLSYAIKIILIIGVMLISLTPLLLTLTMIYQGIKVIRKEGFSIKNLLSLSIGVFFILNSVLGSYLLSSDDVSIYIKYLINYGNLLLGYFVVIGVSYTISSFLNFINIPRKNLEYVVVLGSGLMGDKVTPLLASRIRKGVEIYKKNPKSKLIMSGGQGPDELVPEASAMKNYALGLGIKEEDVLEENKSKNTRENLIFSKRIMEEKSKFAIVSNYYHIFRALLIAREEKISCIGYGAKTKFYFSLNAFIRELIAYFTIKKRLHGVIILILSIGYIVGIFLKSFLS